MPEYHLRLAEPGHHLGNQVSIFIGAPCLRRLGRNPEARQIDGYGVQAIKRSQKVLAAPRPAVEADDVDRSGTEQIAEDLAVSERLKQSLLQTYDSYDGLAGRLATVTRLRLAARRSPVSLAACHVVDLAAY